MAVILINAVADEPFVALRGGSPLVIDQANKG